MRLFGRILGLLFALTWVVILAIFLYALVFEGWRSEYGVATVGGVLVAGFGFVFAGWYYFRADPEAPDDPQPTSSGTRFLVSHRHQLKVLSQTGAALSLIAFIAECFGRELTKPAGLPLLIGAFILGFLTKNVANPEGGDYRDWVRVPEWIRETLPQIQKALGVAWILAIGLILVNELLLHSRLSGSSAYRFAARIILYSLSAWMYAHQALFFQYGELRDENDVTVT